MLFERYLDAIEHSGTKNNSISRKSQFPRSPRWCVFVRYDSYMHISPIATANSIELSLVISANSVHPSRHGRSSGRGGLQEDKAEEVRKLMARFKKWNDEGRTIIFLDHFRKPHGLEDIQDWSIVAVRSKQGGRLRRRSSLRERSMTMLLRVYGTK